MLDRQGANETEEGWTSVTSAGGLTHPQPQSTAARMEKESATPGLEHMGISFPEGWSLQFGENDRFHRDGYAVPGDSGSPQDVKPAWFDEKLFLEGQRTSQKYLAGIAQADLTSLFFLFAFPSGLDPLVATANSDTPEKAGRRYLSTNLRLLSWYTSDPFDPSSDAYRNFVAVRRMHASIRKTCHESSAEELRVKFQIGKDKPRPLLCPTQSLMENTLADIPNGVYSGPCPVLSTLGPRLPSGTISVVPDRYERPFLSQAEMAITQWAFFGLFVTKPDIFAAPYISRRELESILHMWAVIGYCLGIEDRNNWALGGLDAVLRRSEEFLRYVAVPNMRRLSKDGLDRWEHMSRCVIDGMKIYMAVPSFEATMAYMTEDLLELDTLLPKALTWRQTLQLWRLRLVMQYLPRWFGFWTGLMSWAMQKQMRQRGKAAGILPGQEYRWERSQDVVKGPAQVGVRFRAAAADTDSKAL